ncbi:FimB/Mfa2 family fimbrial subunit [uncultured Alistipes sp.]|uniref:FimB/Mfa2 family fimbrial subunit n=1 Tax=uncultured Alistipes sp. TaxID=538949 RepID=UPI00345B5F2B
MKARQYINMMGMAAAVLLSSCVKDTLYDTPHPDHGKITVTADWSARGEGIDIPATWTIAMGDYTGTETTATHAPDYLFAPGSYTLVAWNPAEGITVSGTTATVAPASGSQTTGTFIDNAPGWFFTHAEQVSIEKDTDYPLTAAMQQRVRELQLELEVTQGRPELIQSVTATLSGIAGIFDMEKGQTIGEPTSTVFSFTRDGSKLTADARLLGTMGDVQALVLDIVFTDGGRTQRTEVDLTEALADFNSDMTTAYRVTGTLETPVGMEEGKGEITGWETVEGGDASAEM